MLRTIFATTVGLLVLGAMPTAPVFAQAEAMPAPVEPPTPSVPAPVAEPTLAMPVPVAEPTLAMPVPVAEPSVPAFLPVAASAEPAPPPPAVPPAPPAAVEHQRGLVLLPYLGMNVPVGDVAQRYAPGMRLGVLGGWHLGPCVSLDGEATVDFMDADGDPGFVPPREYSLDLGLSPLVHLRSGTIVLGPKVGWFVNQRWYSLDPGGPRQALAETGNRSAPGYPYVPNVLSHHGQGVVVGFNLGGFTEVGGVRLGMLASVAFRRYLSSGCDDEACGDLLDPLLLGLSVAALL